MDAIIKLRKKIASEAAEERGAIAPTHRYHTISHKMREVAPILTGKYLEVDTRKAPPKELLEAMGVPVSPALKEAQKEVERG
jgi:NAD(P)H-quinone oxidoreductase subunit K